MSSVEDLYYHFCHSVAVVFEGASELIKTSLASKGKLVKVDVFAAPYDVFMMIRINNTTIIRSGKVVYDSSN
mgnify:CR=1 FL=1